MTFQDSDDTNKMESEQSKQMVDHTAAIYTIDDVDITVTVADVEAVRAQLMKPHSEDTIRELSLVQKLVKRDQGLDTDTRERRFFENLAAIRAQAIADGTAIDDPREAAVDD